MAQGYYTLSEAAEFVGISVDALRQMAQKGEIRSFQDRGTLRFRSQDIQALATKRGQSSDPDLALGDSAVPTSSPSSAARRAGPKTPPGRQATPEVFDFELDAEEKVDLGADFLGPKSKSESKSPKSPPAPTRASDSDVRLVADGRDGGSGVGRDMDVMLADTPAPVISPKSAASSSPGSRRSSQMSPGSGVQQRKPARSSKLPSPLPGGPQPADSGARLVPMDSDSDVKLVPGSDDVSIGRGVPTSQTDTDVRLDESNPPADDSGEGDMQRTEEINLDEEIRKQEEHSKGQLPTQMKAKSKLKLPANAPFELSDSEVPSELLDGAGPPTPQQVKEQPAESSDFEMSAVTPDDGSSNFDLTPTPGVSSPVADSDDFSLEASDDHEQALPDESTELTSSSSGIATSDPLGADASLEVGGAQADEDVDFDLSLEVEDTPKPQLDEPVEDSGDFQLKAADTPNPVEANPVNPSSEFELTLDSDSELQTTDGQEDGGDIDLSLDAEEQSEPTDDSEFEINLDGSGEGQSGASEFELTLDDSAEAELEEAAAAPQVKTKMEPAEEEEQDIFESDFEVPALEEGEDEAAADSELESSDFDLALDDSEMANEEESGSQVVALDEDEDAETQVDSDEDAAVVDDAEVEEEESDFEQLDADVEVDADVEAEDETEIETDDEDAEPASETQTVTKTKLVEPAPWGVMPVIFMLPCVVVMLLVSFIGYEMVQSSVGNRPPGVLTVQVAGLFGHDLTKKR